MRTQILLELVANHDIACEITNIAISRMHDECDAGCSSDVARSNVGLCAHLYLHLCPDIPFRVPGFVSFSNCWQQ